MSTIPTLPGTEPEVDDETRETLDERLKTIDRDANASEEWTTSLKDQRIRQLNALAPK